MITKENALQIGKAIVKAATAEKDDCWNDPQACYVINGSLHRALDNIWYDVLPEKTKAGFDYDNQKFLDMCHKV